MAASDTKVFNGCLGVLGLVVVLALIGQCSSKEPAVQPFASPSLENQIEAIEPPLSIDPLNAQSVKRGIQHLRTVLDAEGLSGAMIYSQNCYDALTRDFSWEKLDLCGAVDMLAARAATTSDMEGLDTESIYFDPEAAAGRYLAAATKAGEDAGKADLRLEELKKKTARASLPARPKEVPEADDELPVDVNSISEAV